MDGLDAQEVEPRHRSGHIHDRVHRADVVEADFIDRGAVSAGLSLGQPPEDARRGGFDPIGQPAPLQEAEDLGEVPVTTVGLSIHFNVNLGGPKRPLLHLPPRQPVAPEWEFRQLGPERVERDAGVHQGPQDHVAAGAARTIEVGELHHRILAISLLI